MSMSMSKEKEILFVSFSGGRTSAYMVDILLKKYGHIYQLVILFANTGQEHDETLEFVRKCDERWGNIVIWLEAVVDPEKGKGTRYKVVDYKTCTRRDDFGEDTPFVQVISKYGLPGPASPHLCTRELKGAVMGSYRRDYEKKTKKKYLNAIGMRTDEVHRRLSPEKEKKFRVFYPLLDLFPTEKSDVLSYWEEQDFDLQIPEHLGNCVTCWKKSKNKHLLIAKMHPEYYDFNRVMEEQHENTNNKPDYPPRRFFRGNKSADELLSLAGMIPVKNIVIEDSEDEDGCGESCDAATEESLDFDNIE